MYYDGENIAHVLFSRVIAYDPVTPINICKSSWLALGPQAGTILVASILYFEWKEKAGGHLTGARDLSRVGWADRLCERR